MKYKVTISETLKRDINVEADSIEEAEQIVNDDWHNGAYILDYSDFIEVDFSAKKIQDTIRVVVLEPYKQARIEEISANLESYQKVVGGFIEPFCPFSENVCIICNEEGKINGSPQNRVVYSESGKLLDIIFGTAFICDCSGETFESLTDEQLEKYSAMFKDPLLTE